MSPPVLRLCALLSVVAVLAYAAVQRHTIASYAGDPPRTLPGVALREAPEITPWWPSSFAEGATVEAFLRRGDGLYNVYSLQSGEASLKDCKT